MKQVAAGFNDMSRLTISAVVWLVDTGFIGLAWIDKRKTTARRRIELKLNPAIERGIFCILQKRWFNSLLKKYTDRYRDYALAVITISKRNLWSDPGFR